MGLGTGKEMNMSKHTLIGLAGVCACFLAVGAVGCKSDDSGAAAVTCSDGCTSDCSGGCKCGGECATEVAPSAAEKGCSTKGDCCSTEIAPAAAEKGCSSGGCSTKTGCSASQG